MVGFGLRLLDGRVDWGEGKLCRCIMSQNGWSICIHVYIFPMLCKI